MLLLVVVLLVRRHKADCSAWQSIIADRLVADLMASAVVDLSDTRWNMAQYLALYR